MRRAVVHPGADLAYASYILEGLARLLGPGSIAYSTDGFDRAVRGGRVLTFYDADQPDARWYVSLHDRARLKPIRQRRGAVYGMVNVTTEDVQTGHALAVGPLFGIRLGSRRLTVRHVRAKTAWHLRRREVSDAGDVLVGAWKHETRRVHLDRYRGAPSEPDYQFFVAWPWAKHPEVNPPRAQFIDACRRAPGLTFEGGFAPRRRRDVPGLESHTALRRYPMREYLDRVARSTVAFNNPAVHGCLGWKLGEYLALGKAIVTLPLGRALPAPLEHGVHVHVVDGTAASLDDALDQLRHDHAYRARLELNARDWYEEHLRPEAVVHRLLAAGATTQP